MFLEKNSEKRDSKCSGRNVIVGSVNLTRAILSTHVGAWRDKGGVAAGGGNAESALAILERIGFGYLVFDAQRKVIGWNVLAQATLERRGEKADTPAEISGAFRRLISNLSVQLLPNSVSWVVMPSRYGKPVILSEPHSVSEEASIVVLIDRDARPHPNPQTLQRMFSLTSAETQLALCIARGDAPLDIARSRQLSRTTIRSQLASLFAKTETKRQAELVSLLDRMAVLP